jgi:hypothetical protein
MYAPFAPMAALSAFTSMVPGGVSDGAGGAVAAAVAVATGLGTAVA